MPGTRFNLFIVQCVQFTYTNTSIRHAACVNSTFFFVFFSFRLALPLSFTFCLPSPLYFSMKNKIKWIVFTAAPTLSGYRKIRQKKNIKIYCCLPAKHKNKKEHKWRMEEEKKNTTTCLQKMKSNGRVERARSSRSSHNIVLFIAYAYAHSLRTYLHGQYFNPSQWSVDVWALLRCAV